MAQFGTESVDHFRAECLDQFVPERVDHFAAESVAGLLRNPHINLKMIESLRSKLEATGKSGATINRYLSRLRTILNKAHKVWGVIDSVPFFEMAKEKSRHRVITRKEEKLLLELLDSKSLIAGAVVRVLIDTGMRTGECLQLKLRYVDLQKRRVYVREELDQRTKTGESRIIPMTQRVYGVFQRFIQQAEDNVRIFNIDQFKLNKLWQQVRKEMGLEHDKSFVPHALRHTCASRLVDEGVDAFTIQKLLGHKTIITTQKYANASPKALTSAVSSLDRYSD